MADFVGVTYQIVVAFLLKFALQYNVAAQGNREATPAVQVTVASSQSAASLSSVSPTETTVTKNYSSGDIDSDLQCPDGVPCSDLGASCIQCKFNYSCVYGKDVEVQCKAIRSIKCTVSKRYVVINLCCKFKFSLTLLYLCTCKCAHVFLRRNL